MTLATFVQIVARGKGRARPLTLDEAKEAMTLILRGRAAPEAVGALLMVLRMRGETTEEIAGFTAAFRDQTRAILPKADLDWPVYAAGRSRGAPLFLLAARLVAQAGYRIHMHGAAPSRQMALAGPEVGYSKLNDLNPEAARLLALRDSFGLRSCINTVLRMWRPSGAPASVQGVFHPSYRGLQATAADLLGQQDLTIIKGGGGEFERHPAKTIALFGLRAGQHIQEAAPPLWQGTRRLHEASEETDAAALWNGDAQDSFATATITGTAAIALWTVRAEPTLSACENLATALWTDRHRSERKSA